MCTDSAQRLPTACIPDSESCRASPSSTSSAPQSGRPVATARRNRGRPFDRPDSTGSTESDAIDAIDRQVLGYVTRRTMPISGRTAGVASSTGRKTTSPSATATAGGGPIRTGSPARRYPYVAGPGPPHDRHPPARATSVWVPGANDRAMVALLRPACESRDSPPSCAGAGHSPVLILPAASLALL